MGGIDKAVLTAMGWRHEQRVLQLARDDAQMFGEGGRADAEALFEIGPGAGGLAGRAGRRGGVGGRVVGAVVLVGGARFNIFAEAAADDSGSGLRLVNLLSTSTRAARSRRS